MDEEEEKNTKVVGDATNINDASSPIVDTNRIPVEVIQLQWKHPKKLEIVEIDKQNEENNCDDNIVAAADSRK